jgi:hypothetical protein
MQNLICFLIVLGSYNTAHKPLTTIPYSSTTKSISAISFAKNSSSMHTANGSLEILEDSLQQLYSIMNLKAYDLTYEVFRYGMIGYYNLQREGKLNDKNLLSIIDFTQPSSSKRFYVLDLNTLQVRYHSYVSHGRNTGENIAKSFSNAVHSNQSSMGFYVTAETYVGSKGYSLKLDGVETGYNDNMRNRAVVMHEADYVSEYWIKQYGRLGRSQGCPALPKEIAHQVIDVIKNHTAIFAYFNDAAYINTSAYLNPTPLFNDELMARHTGSL